MILQQRLLCFKLCLKYSCWITVKFLWFWRFLTPDSSSWWMPVVIAIAFFYIKAAIGCPRDELSNFPSKYTEVLQKRVLDRIVFVGANKRDWLIKQRNFKRRLTWVSGRLNLFGNKYHHLIKVDVSHWTWIKGCFGALSLLYLII